VQQIAQLRSNLQEAIENAKIAARRELDQERERVERETADAEAETNGAQGRLSLLQEQVNRA
jgi:hypothetical protein